MMFTSVTETVGFLFLPSTPLHLAPRTTELVGLPTLTHNLERLDRLSLREIQDCKRLAMSNTHEVLLRFSSLGGFACLKKKQRRLLSARGVGYQPTCHSADFTCAVSFVVRSRTAIPIRQILPCLSRVWCPTRLFVC